MSRVVRFGAGALADLSDVAAELGLDRQVADCIRTFPSRQC